MEDNNTVMCLTCNMFTPIGGTQYCTSCTSYQAHLKQVNLKGTCVGEYTLGTTEETEESRKKTALKKAIIEWLDTPVDGVPNIERVWDKELINELIELKRTKEL
jgi:hypothetical protein